MHGAHPRSVPAMSSVSTVEEIVGLDGEQLTARDAWRTVRSYGWWRLVRESFIRFRYGDGFSHSRALGLQLALAAVPLVIAAVGLSSALGQRTAGVVLSSTILELTPRASDPLLRQTLSPFGQDSDVNLLALALGVLAAVLALTSAMGQLERGANRIYGIQRDRPTRAKYGRSLVLALTAGLPALAGLLVVVTAEAFAEAVEQVYGIEDAVVRLLTLPLGAALLIGAITAMLRRAPFRRQPGLSLLALGAGVALVVGIAATALLAGFLDLAAEIGTIYGPLTGVMALLVWAQLTAGALLLGLAVSAQLEQAQVGRRRPAGPAPPEPDGQGRMPAC